MEKLNRSNKSLTYKEFLKKFRKDRNLQTFLGQQTSKHFGAGSHARTAYANWMVYKIATKRI